MIEYFDQLAATIKASELCYIDEMDYDLINSTLKLSLCDNPDSVKSKLTEGKEAYAEFKGKLPADLNFGLKQVKHRMSFWSS